MTNPAAKPREPLPHRAANVGIWAPIIAVFLSAVAQGGLKENNDPTIARYVNLMIVVVSGCFILIGFTASVIALMGIHRHGRKNLLGRGLVGLAFNGFFILCLVFLLFFFHPFSGIESRLAGAWERPETKGHATEQFEFRTDKTFRVTVTGDRAADFSGVWRVAAQKDTKLVLVLTIKNIVRGDGLTPEQTMAFGLDKVEGDQLTLSASDGTIVYHRVAGR